ARGRTGIWFIGARGSVATTATIGSLAVTAGLASDTGLVSELAPINTAAAPIRLADLVIAGYDPSDGPLVDRGETLAASGVFPLALVPALRPELSAVHQR